MQNKRIDEIREIINNKWDKSPLMCNKPNDVVIDKLAQAIYNSEKERVKGVVDVYNKILKITQHKETYEKGVVKMWRAIKQLATLYEGEE